MRVQTPWILLPTVWPPPLSLATTRGISVDVFSSSYLDGSVQTVPHVQLFDSLHVARRRVSPFGNLRISAHLQLPEAYRSLSRPSSAPDAKAFPLRSFMLDLVGGSLRLLGSNIRDQSILQLLVPGSWFLGFFPSPWHLAPSTCFWFS